MYKLNETIISNLVLRGGRKRKMMIPSFSVVDEQTEVVKCWVKSLMKIID